MEKSRKPAKKSATTSENQAQRTNVLLEAIQKEIGMIAEGMADVHPRVVKLETSVQSLVDDMALLKSAVQANTRGIQANTEDIQENTKDIKEIKVHLERIESRLEAMDERLKTTETKFS